MVVLRTVNSSVDSFEKTVIGITISSVTLIVLFVIAVFAEKQIDEANQFRFNSFMLANRLYQSSDDLTRMVRTFSITKNPLYKEHYQEILDIRNGKKPIPQDYNNNYWNLVLLDDKRPTPFSTNSIALLQRMRQAGFSDKEFAKLAQAKENSDALTTIEFQAMEVIESNLSTPKQQLQAIASLYDENYHRAKVLIMKPLSQLYNLVDMRTQKKIHIQRQILNFINIFLIIDILLLLFFLWRLRKMLMNILGTSMENIHQYISEIGEGNFSSVIAVKENMQESIVALIFKAQQKLKMLSIQ